MNVDILSILVKIHSIQIFTKKIREFVVNSTKRNQSPPSGDLGGCKKSPFQKKGAKTNTNTI